MKKTQGFDRRPLEDFGEEFLATPPATVICLESVITLVKSINRNGIGKITVKLYNGLSATPLPADGRASVTILAILMAAPFAISVAFCAPEDNRTQHIMVANSNF